MHFLEKISFTFVQKERYLSQITSSATLMPYHTLEKDRAFNIVLHFFSVVEKR